MGNIYIKLPIVVEAYQTTIETVIHTLEGDMKALPGDYIITGINGEQYPCKPDIFLKTYTKYFEDKYIKKPIVVEAYKTITEVTIHTPDGDLIAMPGDYIITGINGEQYPCKPDIFLKSYIKDSETENTALLHKS